MVYAIVAVVFVGVGYAIYKLTRKDTPVPAVVGKPDAPAGPGPTRPQA